MVAQQLPVGEEPPTYGGQGVDTGAVVVARTHVKQALALAGQHQSYEITEVGPSGSEGLGQVEVPYGGGISRVLGHAQDGETATHEFRYDADLQGVERDDTNVAVGPDLQPVAHQRPEREPGVEPRCLDQAQIPFGQVDLLDDPSAVLGNLDDPAFALRRHVGSPVPTWSSAYKAETRFSSERSWRVWRSLSMISVPRKVARTP